MKKEKKSFTSLNDSKGTEQFFAKENEIMKIVENSKVCSIKLMKKINVFYFYLIN